VRDQLELLWSVPYTRITPVGRVQALAFLRLAHVLTTTEPLQARVLGELAQRLLQGTQDDPAPVRSSSEPSADAPLASTLTAFEASSNATP
jgi:hypothetical protein